MIVVVGAVVLTACRSRSHSTEPEGPIFNKPEFVQLASLYHNLEEEIEGRRLSYHPIVKFRPVKGTGSLGEYDFCFDQGCEKQFYVDVHKSGETGKKRLFGMTYHLIGPLYGPDVKIKFVGFRDVESRPFTDEQIKQVLDIYTLHLQKKVQGVGANKEFLKNLDGICYMTDPVREKLKKVMTLMKNMGLELPVKEWYPFDLKSEKFPGTTYRVDYYYYLYYREDDIGSNIFLQIKGGGRQGWHGFHYQFRY